MECEWFAQHKDELQAILSTENIDICLLSETHFTSETYIKFTNYVMYHITHPANTARGGSAVIIRNSIKHYEEEKTATYDMQVTSVTIVTTKQTLTVCAIYCPPRHNIYANQYLELVHKLGGRFIIGGDFNAKHTHWGSRLTTSKGRELYQASMDYGCEFVSTGKPTYWPTDLNKMPDLIDFFVIKNVSTNYIKIDEVYDLNSDHSPMLLTICEHIITKDQNSVLINKLTDWDYFNFLLEDTINMSAPLKTTDNLENEVYNFTSAIQHAAWKSTPTIKRKLKGLNFPKEIKNIIAEKRKLRKRWHQTRALQDKTNLNRITHQLTKEIRALKNSINKFLIDLTADNSTEYSLWKVTKFPKRPISQIPPIRKNNGRWARNNNNKTETFAEHLQNRFLPNPGSDELPELS